MASHLRGTDMCFRIFGVLMNGLGSLSSVDLPVVTLRMPSATLR